MQVFSSQRGVSSDIVIKPYLRPWIFGMAVILASWVGASLLLDVVIMPEMATGGMMRSNDFVPAGFSLFQRFNSFEILAGSLLLASGLFLIDQKQVLHKARLTLVAIALFVIPLVYFYGLVPQMAGLGFGLEGSLTQPLSSTMDSMHTAYWGLDCFKLVCAGFYLNELWLLLKHPQSKNI